MNTIDSGLEMSEQAGESHRVERIKKVWKPNPETSTRTFTSRSLIGDAPQEFYRKVIQQCVDWQLLTGQEVSIEELDFEKFRTLISSAQKIINNPTAEFLKAYEEKPYDYGAIEAEYSIDEITKLNPIAKEVGDKLSIDTKYIFRFAAGNYPLTILEQENTRKVLLVVDTEKSTEEINEYAKSRPEIIPSFKAIKLKSGKTAILVDWVDGQYPKTDKESQLVLSKLDQLLRVPIDGQSYDINRTNLKITEDKKIYYVDKDAIEAIAQFGYCRPDSMREEMLRIGIEEKFKQ